jgi:hypothetical protein
MTKIALMSVASVAFVGMAMFKNTPPVVTLEALSKELGDASALLKTAEKAMNDKYVELNNAFGGVKGDTDELKKAAEAHAKEYAEFVTKFQTMTQVVEQIKKEMDAPAYRTGGDKKDADTEAAIELQKQIAVWNGADAAEFKPDMTKLANMDDVRSAAYKLAKHGGNKTRESIVKEHFTEGEKKAFEGASMDAAFFNPQILGLEVDCNIECAELLDLYNPVSVSRSTFKYPQVVSYGDIGSYQCDAKCDAELGPEGNIRWLNGNTYDFRGVFCFQKEVLNEANYDLLGFMIRSAQRSHRINRNRALITGDGVNEPKGWLTQDCFTKMNTGGATFSHQDFRRFISSAPVEYGEVVATMHQNVFGYLAAMLDANGRFIFGDGLMTYSPDDVRDRIRISNCLPDPTEGNTLGSAENPFDANSFILAAGNWKQAFSVVSKRALMMEQFIGGSSMWCVKYQFGAQDGGFTMCCPAARTLYTA